MISHLDVSALTEAFDGVFAEEFVGFFEQCGEAGGVQAGGFGGGGEIVGVDLGGVEAGEPVAAVAQEVVAHCAVALHVEGFGEVAEPEHDGEVHFAGGVLPFGEGEVKGVAEVGFDGGGVCGV